VRIFARWHNGLPGNSAPILINGVRRAVDPEALSWRPIRAMTIAKSNQFVDLLKVCARQLEWLLRENQ
jgi:hypothetical protein